MLRFAIDGILSFSARPLQLSVVLGAVSAALALLVICYSLALRIVTHEWVPGWTALMIAVLFMGGVQLLCVGILGEYVARIYREVKRRPLYVVQETVGFQTPDSGNAK
jgi:dolichol-phosphate mannosyltransferase